MKGVLEVGVGCKQGLYSDKQKEFGFGIENTRLLKFYSEVLPMPKNDAELLNAVYKEISEELGAETAVKIYQMFKGQQISFPVRFFDPQQVQTLIVREYDGTNIKKLAVKYDYSEKTVRRIIKKSLEKADDRNEKVHI